MFCISCNCIFRVSSSVFLNMVNKWQLNQLIYTSGPLKVSLVTSVQTSESLRFSQRHSGFLQGFLIVLFFSFITIVTLDIFPVTSLTLKSDNSNLFTVNKPCVADKWIVLYYYKIPFYWLFGPWQVCCPLKQQLFSRGEGKHCSREVNKLDIVFMVSKLV